MPDYIDALQRHLTAASDAVLVAGRGPLTPEHDAWLDACVNAEYCALSYVRAAEARLAGPALSPCPFCGSSALRVSSAGHSVFCRSCNALGPPGSDDASAAAAWNRALRTAETITCAECGEQVQVGGCACGGQGMNASNSRNTQKPWPVRRPRTQLVHEVCRNRLAIYEVFRADQKAEDETPGIDPAPVLDGPLCEVRDADVPQ